MKKKQKYTQITTFIEIRFCGCSCSCSSYQGLPPFYAPNGRLVVQGKLNLFKIKNNYNNKTILIYNEYFSNFVTCSGDACATRFDFLGGPASTVRFETINNSCPRIPRRYRFFLILQPYRIPIHKRTQIFTKPHYRDVLPIWMLRKDAGKNLHKEKYVIASMRIKKNVY